MKWTKATKQHSVKIVHSKDLTAIIWENYKYWAKQVTTLVKNGSNE